MKKLILLVTLSASTSYGIGLKEAIKGAIQNNPRTTAIDLRMQAMQDRKKAQYMDLLPSLHIGSSANFSQNQMAGGTSRSTSYGNNVGVSMNLYNGGADVESLRAAEERLKATDAEYNSSNSQIPNTRGRFASSVFESYISLVENYEQKNFVVDLKKKLEFLQKAHLNEEERETLNQRITDLETSMVNVDYGISEAQKDFTYFTTLPAPQALDLESFDQLRSGLVIPENAEKAFQIALEKSPDIQSMNHRLAAETHEREADKRKLFRPRVDLNASYNDNTSRGDSGPSVNSKGAYVGVSLTYTIGAGSVYRNRAGNKELEATRSERDATLADVQYSLNARYHALANQEKVQSLQQQNLQTADTRLATIFKKIEKGDKIEFKDMIAAVDTRSNYWQSNLQLKRNIIAARFNLQRTVGTLFDEITFQ
ncbi:TolC family protein [Pseudobdellovibrio sp. HCB154]|uniref:TolC family protein n=1 Tax=Pseudobdellovibrio sp. HCB154 TaxID=3386277 RepID=UPI003916ECC3